MIGWHDGDDVYLDLVASFKVAREMSSDGSGLSISANTLPRRLKDQGLLASTGVDSNRETLLVRRVADGRRRNLLHLLARTFGVTEGTAEKGNVKY
jgi:hypothetical protein